MISNQSFLLKMKLSLVSNETMNFVPKKTFSITFQSVKSISHLLRISFISLFFFSLCIFVFLFSFLLCLSLCLYSLFLFFSLVSSSPLYTLLGLWRESNSLTYFILTYMAEEFGWSSFLSSIFKAHCKNKYYSMWFWCTLTITPQFYVQLLYFTRVPNFK